MNLLKEIVNGRLIVTGKGGGDKHLPLMTLVFDIETDALIDLEYYESEEDAMAGHQEAIEYYTKEKKDE